VEKTLLQWHRDVAEQILSIHLNVFNVEDIEDVVKVLATPFDNVKSKKFQRKIYKWIKGISSKKIYHMINGYGIHLRMINQYQYKPNTLILYGEMHELYKRQKERDLEDSRHIGHIVTRYKDGDFPNTPDDLDDFEQFKSRCDDRQYDHFHIGNYKRINVTHFEDVNLNEILLWINNQFKH